MTDSDYQAFLASKTVNVIPAGIPKPGKVNKAAFLHQGDIITWALKRGRAAIFAGCGMGKTLMQLDWAHKVHKHTKGDILILAPLAVNLQTVAEGEKFGVTVNHARSQADIQPGINITNYEMLQHFDASHFSGVVLDESSIIKAYDGKTTDMLLSTFAQTAFKLACTATPSPNDFMELGNHAEFLGVMSRVEMLATFFVHDGGETSKWRLKGHAAKDFWKWLCQWAVMIHKPSDLGYSDDGFILPPLNVHHYVVDSQPSEGQLFAFEARTLQERQGARKASIDDRIAKAVEIVNSKPDEPFLIWCNLNEEADKIQKLIPGSVNIQGSDKPADKEKNLMGFAKGDFRVLISKPKLAGFGMNWQHCNQVIYVGLSDSFEQYYQSVRRCYRFGQTQPVDAHIVTSEAEGAVVANIQKKEAKAKEMSDRIMENMRDEMNKEIHGITKQTDDYKEDLYQSDKCTLYMGDCVEKTRLLADESVHYSVFSPPFSSLYTYSNSIRDMGNCRNDDDFMQHFTFLVKELFRVLKSGRLVSFHCMNLPTSKQNHGYIGIRDFRGELIRLFQDAGFIFHSEVVIWKDPVVAMQRTKALGLLYKQLKKDSAMSRQGIPDYLVTMRKPGTNDEPVTHDPEDFPVGVWQNYASPVWMDINPSDTLQYRSAREHDDERHICLATDSLVLTRDGFKQIKDVTAGNEVLTHLGRWRKVIASMSTGFKPVIALRAQGVGHLNLTPDHKLWTRKASGTHEKMQASKSDPNWIRADETVKSYVNLKLPPIEKSDLTLQECWLLGRWLADGHVGVKGDFFISVGKHKTEEFETILAPYLGQRQTLAAYQYRLKGLSKNIVEHLKKCGKGAAEKQVPANLLSLEPESAKMLVDGYLSGDGHNVPSRNRWMATSVSRALLLGMAMMIQRAYGAVSSLNAGREPGTTVIEGRTVNTQQEWILSFDVPTNDRKIKPFILEDGAWKKVRSAEPAGETEVWCLQIEEDASFTAEGCIVKNCPLQLEVIRRALKLWTNPGDTVLTPFLGIGSEAVVALEEGRKAVGIELKSSYWHQARKNCEFTEKHKKDQLTLLDMDDVDDAQYTDINAPTESVTESVTAEA